jgi:hypothetical protein
VAYGTQAGVAGFAVVHLAPKLILLLVLGLLTVQPSDLCAQTHSSESLEWGSLQYRHLTDSDSHAQIFLARLAPPRQVPPLPGLSPSQRRGIRIGSRIGVVAGGIIGWSLAPDAPDNCVLECGVEVIGAVFSAALGAAGGLVIGGGIGLFVGTLVGNDDDSSPRTAVALAIPLGRFD